MSNMPKTQPGSDSLVTVSVRFRSYDDVAALAGHDSIFGRFLMAATHSLDIRSYATLFNLGLKWFRSFQDFANRHQTKQIEDATFYFFMDELLRIGDEKLILWIVYGMYFNSEREILDEYGSTVKRLYRQEKRKSFKLIDGGLSAA